MIVWMIWIDKSLTKLHKFIVRCNTHLVIFRGGGDDQSEQSHELPAGGEGSTAAGTAKPGQRAGRWIQKLHSMRDEGQFPSFVFIVFHVKENRTGSSSMATQAKTCLDQTFYRSPCWFCVTTCAGSEKHRLSSYKSHNAMRPVCHWTTTPCTSVTFCSYL